MSAAPGARLHCLTPHPSSPPSPVRTLAVEATRAGDALVLRYRLQGDVESLRLPSRPEPAPPASALRADELWRHTCFEAFVAAVDSPAYREFNFSPSGQWAAYDFDGYRKRRDGLPSVLPAFTSTAGRDALELEATLDLRGLTQPRDGEMRLGVTAVIEDRAGVLSYWALEHPAEKPDFHLAASFVIHL
jgi:hypothetical protein